MKIDRLTDEALVAETVSALLSLLINNNNTVMRTPTFSRYIELNGVTYPVREVLIDGQYCDVSTEGLSDVIVKSVEDNTYNSEIRYIDESIFYFVPLEILTEYSTPQLRKYLKDQLK